MKTFTVETTVHGDMNTVWNTWSTPKDIEKWNSASPDWHTVGVKNNLTKGGTFSYRMEAKDGSFGFDFGGTYDEVVPHRSIRYTMDDDRKVAIDFNEIEDGVVITETFDPEDQNPVEVQTKGWQAILNNFKKYVESK